MNEEGFLHERLRPGAYNASEFCVFLEKIFEVLARMDKARCWVTLGNVRFHHSSGVAVCAAHHGHQLIFLPPYGPMLNPIKSLFGNWTMLIRIQGISLIQDGLLARMALARSEITVLSALDGFGM